MLLFIKSAGDKITGKKYRKLKINILLLQLPSLHVNEKTYIKINEPVVSFYDGKVKQHFQASMLRYRSRIMYRLYLLKSDPSD